MEGSEIDFGFVTQPFYHNHCRMHKKKKKKRKKEKALKTIYSHFFHIHPINISPNNNIAILGITGSYKQNKDLLTW